MRLPCSRLFNSEFGFKRLGYGGVFAVRQVYRHHLACARARARERNHIAVCFVHSDGRRCVKGAATPVETSACNPVGIGYYDIHLMTDIGNNDYFPDS